MEYVLHVDILAVAEIYIHTGTHELLDQQRQVEAVGIETAEIAALHETFQRFGYLPECRAILHVLIGDMVYRRRLRRNGNGGVDASGAHYLFTVGHDFSQRYFDDAVARRIDARCLQIEEYYRSSEFQIHISGSLMR